MKMRLKAVVLCAIVVLSCFQMSSPSFAGAKQVAPGPVPTQIAMVKKVFIANAGENQPFFNDPMFTGGQQRAYDEFYAGIKASGRYDSSAHRRTRIFRSKSNSQSIAQGRDFRGSRTCSGIFLMIPTSGW